eukprot:1142610-Pelagomonas_calceolata.AAC.2
MSDEKRGIYIRSGIVVVTKGLLLSGVVLPPSASLWLHRNWSRIRMRELRGGEGIGSELDLGEALELSQRAQLEVGARLKDQRTKSGRDVYAVLNATECLSTFIEQLSACRCRGSWAAV